MNVLRFGPLAVLLLACAAAPAYAQTRIQCESRDYQRQFCATNEGVARAVLVEQRSRSACVEGRSWGWDRRGIWVNEGCEGVFEYQPLRAQAVPSPGPGARTLSCESRDYQYEFCETGETIVSAAIVRQKSRAPCTLGQTWGWRQTGIWVSGGCEGDFQFQAARRASGPQAGRPGYVVCESREYQREFCPTGRIREAQLVNQRSQAPCVQGSSWGFDRNGIWVDRGCEGEFQVFTR